MAAKRIYISGKISGTDPASSRSRFDEAEKALKDAGFEAVNPWNIKPPVQGQPTWAEHIIADLQELAKCDGLCLLENWHTSPGANVEKYFANGMGIPVFYANSEGREAKLIGLDIARLVWEAKDNPKPPQTAQPPARGRKRRGL